MTVTLTAPITEANYNSMQLLKLPDGFTGDPVTNLLNQAWQMIQGPRGTNQPLTATSNTLVELFPSKYCNQQPSGNVQIAPKYLPIISITTLKWSYSVVSNGWTSASQYDITGDTIQCYDLPFTRGDYGMIQLVYTSGYAVIPDDLKIACGLMVAHLLSGGYFPTQGGSSVLPAWLPTDVKLTIDRYSRVR